MQRINCVVTCWIWNPRRESACFHIVFIQGHVNRECEFFVQDLIQNSDLVLEWRTFVAVCNQFAQEIHRQEEYGQSLLDMTFSAQVSGRFHRHIHEKPSLDKGTAIWVLRRHRLPAEPMVVLKRFLVRPPWNDPFSGENLHQELFINYATSLLSLPPPLTDIIIQYTYI